jgi:hypothetical protein
MSTYWVRKNGSAIKSSAVDLANAMSPATFNTSVFDANDNIYFSGIDGDINTGIVVPSGGIKLLADPERGCNINGLGSINNCISIVSKNDVEVDGISVSHPLISGILTGGTSAATIIRDVQASYSGNQGFQTENTASATFYNIYSHHNIDDGFSMHDDAVAVIHGGIFEANAQGINTIAGTHLDANDCVVTGCSGESVYVADIGVTGKIPVAKFYNLRILGGTRGIWGRYNADIEINGAYFDAMSMANHFIDIETTTKLKITNTIFTGMAALKFGLALRSGSLCSLASGLLFADALGKGIFTEADVAVRNSIFVNLVTAIHRSSGVVSIEDSCVNSVTTPYAGTVSTARINTSNPLFIDSINKDYHLQSTSPCIGAGISIPSIHEQATPATDLDGKMIHFLPPSIGPYGEGDIKTITNNLIATGYSVRGTAESPAKIKLAEHDLSVDLSGLTDAAPYIQVKAGSKRVAGFVGKGVNTYIKGSGGGSSDGIFGSNFG